MQDTKSLVVAAVGNSQNYFEPWKKQIQGIVIDNPSGSWLYVEPARKYVPPQTIAWSTDFTPATNNVVIKFVASPTGGTPSAATGGPINITMYDEPVGISAGIAYTAQANLISILNYVKPINNPLVQTSVTVTTTATLLRTTTAIEAISIHNNDTTITVYIGPSNVTSSGANRGYPLKPGGDFALDYDTGQSVYGIVASGSVDVSVIRGAIT